MSLTLNEYQDISDATAVYPGQGEFIGLAYAALGLNGEAGECAERIKKTWRTDGLLTEDNRRLLEKELGDTLWYLSALASELDTDLEMIARMNIQKIAKRNMQNTLYGDGDER